MIKQKKSNKIVIIAAALCALSILVMVGVVAVTNKGKPEAAPFSPPKFDLTAVKGIPTVPENMGYMPIEVEEGYKAFVCGELRADNGNVNVFFTAPDDNTVWLKLKLLDENGDTLGETGVIKPGEYVKTLTLSKILVNSAAVKLKIIAYQPETWFSMGTVGLNTTLTLN